MLNDIIIKTATYFDLVGEVKRSWAVFQGDKKLREFFTEQEALSFVKGLRGIR